ncbi:MAG: HEAT repeat protein [Methanoregulaceae archaeon PtaU1.Bin059]|nr:MAG: HEAT repeat protein [Methanoregulaceae archaeon PtaB.Bin152]OPY35990.1 MAG: HEAT repeat protein [Methanoregulaceae archaeon PtaU1.Bin059]
MSLAELIRQTVPPDVHVLESRGDIRALLALLQSREYTVRNAAADALGRLGDPALKVLHARAARGKISERIGILEALARIRNPASIPFLSRILTRDQASEMRWIAAIALGEIGSDEAIPALRAALKDRDKYVRFGAAQALSQLGWRPHDTEEEVRLLVARQEWSAIPGVGAVPSLVLIEYLDDPDPRIRKAVVSVLGMCGDPVTEKYCERAMRDTDPSVRWAASLAFPQCHVAQMYLPGAMSRRPRTGKNLYVAVFLNIFFLGLGYNYLGKWWGFLLYQINLNTVMLLSLMYKTFLPYPLSLAFTTIAAVHTWHIMKGMPDI